MLIHRYMTQYECMFIINPSIGEKEIAATLSVLKENIEKAGKIIKEDLWGEKKMAYKINGSSKGYYGLLDIEIDGKEIKTMNTTLNLTPNLWRYMFVKKED